MKIETNRLFTGRTAVYFEHNQDVFGTVVFGGPAAAAEYAARARLALAAHDAELDKTRFVELTGKIQRLENDLVNARQDAITEFQRQYLDTNMVREQQKLIETLNARIKELEQQLGTRVGCYTCGKAAPRGERISFMFCKEHVAQAQRSIIHFDSLRRDLARIFAAGPGGVDAIVKVLEKWRDIQSSFTEVPYLREQVAEWKEKYNSLRAKIKELL